MPPRFCRVRIQSIKEVGMNYEVTRRGFLKGAGGLLLPVAAGLPLIARSDLNQGLPRCGNYVATDQGGYSEISLFYFLDPIDGKPPHGSLSFGSGLDSYYKRIEYSTLSASGSTIRMSGVSLGSSSGSLSNCREISLTITSFSGESADLFSSGTGKATLRLQDGTAFYMETDSSLPVGCFLTTACTAARGLPDNCMELQTLRAFRDSYMKTQASDGSAMIRDYYETAPSIVAAINVRDDAAEIFDWMYRDLVVPSVRLIQLGRNARALDHYAEFCLRLIGRI
jgi:hypothetical protein